MLSYEGKLILAPMVRVGTLPMRLLALEYGADLVYAPETVDKALIGSERRVNANGTIDYVKAGRLIYRTHPCERDRLVFQLGTADPQLALQAALVVLPDVAGIDVNCGCPKRFSLQAGMGAALLQEPEKLVRILQTLVGGLPAGFPVTAKIRVFPDVQATLALARAVAATGIRALAVHTRTPACRPRHPARWELLPAIADAIAPLPLIANGDLLDHAGLQRARRVRGVSSLMVARGAQWNVSIFRAAGPLPLREVSQAYLARSVQWAMSPGNCKYTLLQMWMGAQELATEEGAREAVQRLQLAKTFDDMADALGIARVPLPDGPAGLAEEEEGAALQSTV